MVYRSVVALSLPCPPIGLSTSWRSGDQMAAVLPVAKAGVEDIVLYNDGCICIMYDNTNTLTVYNFKLRNIIYNILLLIS